MGKKMLSRRSFLKGAGASAIGAAFAGMTFLNAQAEESSAAVFTPGTYTGTATGMASDVTVTITVDETSILSAVVDSSGETAEIGAAAQDTLAEQIMAVQSQEIDGVTGATVTSDAVRRACEDALAQAKGVDVELLRAGTETAAEDWLGEAPKISESEIAETIDTEVLVIGAGHAGTFAACSAVENGAKTLLIEKLGHDMASGMRDTLAALNSKQQIENDDNPDREEVIRYICDWSQGYTKRSLVEVWADNSGETMDWFTERLDATDRLRGFRHEVDEHNPEDNYKAYDVGHSIQFGEEYYEQLSMDVLLEYAEELGLEVRYETPMVKFEQDEDGRVTGVIAKNSDGQYIRINAPKGVILCTGGYSGNRDMMQALQPQSLEQCCINYSKPGCKGDGIKACLWAGASMDSTHTAMIFERGCVKPDEVGVVDDGQLFWMGSQPFMKVNLDGHRFMNEYMPYDYVLHAASQQPHHTYCTIWDGTYTEDIERFATHGCSRLYPHVNGADPVFPMEMVEGMNADLMERGYIVTADTLEELAEKLGLPVDEFMATVERYNGFAANGKDEDFGKESYRLSTLDTAPFYGVRQAGGYLICTMDGIRINETMHAIREDGSQIDGLYVCGDASGSFFHGSYPNLLAGMAAGRSATFGRLAGKLAAAE